MQKPVKLASDKGARFPASEQRELMRLMRSLVNERNVYRCAVMWSELAGCTRIALGLEH